MAFLSLYAANNSPRHWQWPASTMLVPKGYFKYQEGSLDHRIVSAHPYKLQAVGSEQPQRLPQTQREGSGFIHQFRSVVIL